MALNDAVTSQLNSIFPNMTSDQLSKLQGLNFGNAGAGGPGSNNFGTPIGGNIGTLQAGIGGLSALGNLWTAWNATNLAKQQFNFTSQLATDNYANQATAYNTELSDRARTRSAMENQAPGQADAYVAANRIKTTL